MKARRAALAALGLLSVLPAVAQGVGLDSVAAGPLALHDHVSFEFHQPALGDPYPHEFRQGYGFDGADLGLDLGWHWGGFHTHTLLRVSPAARAHWAYDQDTDTRPGTDFTHGNAGYARSRTFGLGQQIPLGGGRRGGLALRFDFLRQWTRYHAVTTYDLNSNPAQPSTIYSRLISERAIVEELRPEMVLGRHLRRGRWAYSVQGALAPLAWVEIRNYIPVVLATSSTEAYGLGADLAVTRRFGPAAGLRLGVRARWENGYQRAKFFRREQFALHVDWVWQRARQ